MPHHQSFHLPMAGPCLLLVIEHCRTLSPTFDVDYNRNVIYKTYYHNYANFPFSQRFEIRLKLKLSRFYVFNIQRAGFGV
jgi:hypothetical protein